MWQEQFEHGPDQDIIVEVHNLVRDFGRALRKQLCSDKNLKKGNSWKNLWYEEILEGLREEFEELLQVTVRPREYPKTIEDLQHEALDTAAYLAFLWSYLERKKESAEHGDSV